MNCMEIVQQCLVFISEELENKVSVNVLVIKFRPI